MNKAVMIGAVVGGAGIFWIYHMRQSSKTTLGIPAPANSSKTNPANAKGPAARVDNQSQPWYTGALGWAKVQEQKYVQNPALAQSDLQSVIHSTADVWGTLSGLFSSGTAQNTDETPDIASQDPTHVDAQSLTLPSSDQDQSNMIGNQWADSGNQTMDVVMMDQDYNDQYSYIDYSDADGGMGSDNVA